MVNYDERVRYVCKEDIVLFVGSMHDVAAGLLPEDKYEEWCKLIPDASDIRDYRAIVRDGKLTECIDLFLKLMSEV